MFFRFPAIWYATLYGHTRCVEVILDVKPALNQRFGAMQLTMLLVACMKGYPMIVEVLIAAGADPCMEAHHIQHGTTLLLAVRGGHALVVQVLMKTLAAQRLVHKESDWTRDHVDGHNRCLPLHAAAASSHASAGSIINLLLEHGAQPGLQVDCRPYHPVSAFSLAAAAQMPGNIEALARADPKFPTDYDRRILQSTVSLLNADLRKQEETVRRLTRAALDLGADVPSLEKQLEEALNGYVARVNAPRQFLGRRKARKIRETSKGIMDIFREVVSSHTKDASGSDGTHGVDSGLGTSLGTRSGPIV